MALQFEPVAGGWPAALRRDLASRLQLQDFQAVGIVANCEEETGDFRSFVEIGQDPDHGGIGAAMWTGYRHEQFSTWCATHGHAITSYAANIGFIVEEASTSEAAALVALRGTKTAREATTVWCNEYERPGTPRLDVRLQWADRLMAAAAPAPAPSSIQQDVATLLNIGGIFMPAKLTAIITAGTQAVVAIIALLNAFGFTHIDASTIAGVLGVGVAAGAVHKTTTPAG